MAMPDWLVPLLSAGAAAGVVVTAVFSGLGWRWQRLLSARQAAVARELEDIKIEFEQLAHLRTSAERRRAEVAAEALGATVRFGVVLKRAGEAPGALGVPAPSDRAGALYLREALARSWGEIAPLEQRFEQAWDQALVYLDDERVTDLMERLWRLKETRHKELLASLAGEAIEPSPDGERRAAPGNPNLLEGPEFERYIQFVEAIDDIVREAREVIRPLVR
jgi:hypothetical protein